VISLVDCIPRGVYRIKSRNLRLGVYAPGIHAGGFIGLREKFGSEYLFTEYHWDTGPPFGTVTPTELLGELPENIHATEYLPQTRCSTCGESLTFVPDEPPHRTPGTWVHDARSDCEEAWPVLDQYEPLFVYLQNYERVLGLR
jgi:hypothetical protein